MEVIDSNPAFDVTHEKSMVIDDETAFVKSLNWETKNLTETRDYAVTTDAPPRGRRDRRLLRGRLAPEEVQRRERSRAPHLVPGNGRDRIAHFIDQAKHTLFVQNERYQDAVIIERLVRAARRGVKIHVMARPPHTLKKDKLVEGVGGLRIMDDVGDQDSQAQAPQAARQDAAGRRHARHRRLDQPRPGQLRQTGANWPSRSTTTTS